MHMQEKFEEAIQNISKNHRKIIDDWCKAYLAEIYQYGLDIKPGCFTLIEQQDFVSENGKLVKKYWFELKDEKETANERIAKQLIDELLKVKEYVLDQINDVKKNHPDQFQAILILNQIKRMLNFVENCENA